MLPHNAFIRTDVQQHKLLQPKISKRRIMVKIIIITEIPIESKENNKKQTTVFHAENRRFSGASGDTELFEKHSNINGFWLLDSKISCL